MAKAIENDQYLDCKNIKPCSSAVYSLVNPSSTMFPPPTKGGKAFPEEAMMIIQFENTMVCITIDYLLKSVKLILKLEDNSWNLNL